MGEERQDKRWTEPPKHHHHRPIWWWGAKTFKRNGDVDRGERKKLTVTSQIFDELHGSRPAAGAAATGQEIPLARICTDMTVCALNLYAHGPIKKSSSIQQSETHRVTAPFLFNSTSITTLHHRLLRRTYLMPSEWDIVWIPRISVLRSEFDSFN